MEVSKEIHDAISKAMQNLDKRLAAIEKPVAPSKLKRPDEVCDCLLCKAISELKNGE